MLVVNKRKKWFLKLETVQFADNYLEYKTDAHIVEFELCKRGPDYAEKVFTILIDLSKSEEEIFSQFNKNTRTSIRKSQREDNLQFYLNMEPTGHDIREFYEAYRILFKTKDFTPVLISRIEQFNDAGALAIASVADMKLGTISSGCYVIDGDYVRGWLAGSYLRDNTDPDIKKLVGRANRVLEWQCMKKFKSLGFLIFDLGGVTLHPENEQMSNIDRFKMGFGGSIATLYNFRQGKTFLGKAALCIHNVASDLKALINKSQKPV